MIEFISNEADVNVPDDYAIWMFFFLRKLRMLRIKSFLIKSISNSTWRTSVILWSTPPLWPLLFNSFSTSQILQMRNNIITRFVGA